VICWQNTRTPRAWQAKALSQTIDYIVQGGRAGMISAIMGAGKTDLTSELCRVAQHWGWRVLVTVPTQRLVRQTSAAIRKRLGDEAVGTYWQHGRDYNTPVVVACTRSLGKLQVEPCDYDLWIADEAHGTETLAVLVFAETIAPNRLIGLSATPFRADEREALSLFQDLVCSYSAADALADGVLVPWRFPDPLVATGADALADLNDACTEWIKKRTGPGIVSANTIGDAEEYAAELCDAGVRAMAVHSQLSDEVNDRRLDALQRGELDCVVHVCVLVEGVDLPWIRWMCLRRRRGSRNAHVQEIGRGLRAHPGKTHCDFFDPHSLFGLHQINDPARLGDYLRNEAEEREEAERIPLVDAFTGEEFAAEIPVADRRRVRATHAAHQWILAAAAALRCEGIIPPPGENKHWRTLPATPAQIALLSRAAGGERDNGRVGGWVAKMTQLKEPELNDLARAYRSAYARRSGLRRGTASDLISILACTRRDYVDSRGAIHPSKLPALLGALRRYGVTYPEQTNDSP